MNYFYHPFGENGNIGREFLLSENDDTIIITGQNNLPIYPMLRGKVTKISENSITINSNVSGYSKYTKKDIDIIYENLKVDTSFTVNSEVTEQTRVGILDAKGDNESPYLSIKFRASDDSIDITSIYETNPDLIPNYKKLQKKGLLVYKKDIDIAAGSNYAKMLFSQGTQFMASYESYTNDGIVSIAVNELCDMIENPYLYTGHSKDGLGAKNANKYQSAAGFGLGVEWCVLFVTYCADMAGFVESGLYPSRTEASCSNLISTFEKNGNSTKPAINYTPVPGDLIFFNWDADSSIDHIGIVYKITENGIFTIEGNSIRTPKNFIYTVSQLDNEDPIKQKVLTVLGEKEWNSNIANKYDNYIRENYNNHSATLYSEYNGVSLLFYDYGNSNIEEYIHLE